jgi:hypothetical protein
MSLDTSHVQDILLVCSGTYHRLSGVAVSVLATGPKVAGSNLAEAMDC